MSKRWRDLHYDVKEVLNDRHIDLAPFRGGRFFDISAKNDVGNIADTPELALQVVAIE